MSHTLYHFGDAETLAKSAAERWRAALLKRNPTRPFTVALSGGRIPKALYKAFAGLAAGDSLEGVHFFWGDERVVPPTDPDHAGLSGLGRRSGSVGAGFRRRQEGGVAGFLGAHRQHALGARFAKSIQHGDFHRLRFGVGFRHGRRATANTQHNGF